MRHLRWFVLALLLASAGMAAEHVTLARDGGPAIAIVLAETAHPSVRATAGELAEVLGTMLGGPVPIETGDGAAGIALGLPGDFPRWHGDHALRLDRLANPDDLAVAQSYIIRSHAQGVALIGATEIGVEYAAWDFLYRLGHRQFFPGPVWEVAPRLTGDVTLRVDAYETPAYLARNIWYGWGGNADPKDRWNFRNRTTFHGHRVVAIRPEMPRRWTTTLINTLHIYGAIISMHRALFDAHPEYLALVQGERTLRGSKLCLSHPDVPPLAVAYARQFLARFPFAASVSMDPADGYGWCECEPCAALGPPQNRMLGLANYVATALEATHPAVYVGVLAYNLHAEPPTIDAHPRVFVKCATNLSGNLPIEQRLAGWGQRASAIGVRDYWAVAQWHHAMPGRMRGGNLAYLTTAIPNYHALGARAMTAESGDCWGANGLGYYVAARLLWDPAEAARAPEIVADFLTRAFGPAADAMRDYYALVDDSRNAEIGGPRPGSLDYFEDRVPRMYRVLLEALELADGDPLIEARLDHLLLYTRHVQLWAAHRRVAAGADDELEAQVRRQLALERFLRFGFAIRETGMAHWHGINRVTSGANTIDLQSAPSWLPAAERDAFAASPADTRAARAAVWTSVTPALIAETRQAARLAVKDR